MTAACADCIDPALMALAPANLRYRRVDVANERNGFLDLRRATELIVGNEMRPDVEHATDADDVRWVEQNQAALHLIEAAVWAPEFQLPLFDLDQNWAPYRQAMRLKTARACVHAAAGRWHDAAQDLIETFEIGQRMKRGDPVLISYLVANAIQGCALRGMQELAAHPSVPSAVRLWMADALRAAPPGCEEFARTLQVEMMTFVVPGYLIALRGEGSSVVDAILADSKCTPKSRCRSVLTQLTAKHPSPFDAADQIQASGRLIAALVEQCENPAARPVGPTDEAWLDRTLGPVNPPARDLLTTITEGGPLRPTSADVERATAQLAGVPNPIGRFLLRRSHMAYFPTELQANYAATLEALAR